MRVSAFLLVLISPALVSSKATIDNEWELFENTVKRWDVKIRDKRDMAERFSRLKAFKRSVDMTTSGVTLDSLNAFSVANDEEHEATMEMRRRAATFNHTKRADKETVSEKKLMDLAKRHGHHEGVDEHTYEDYWEKEIGFNEPGNQGGCGACWAFAALGAVEALYKELTGEKVDLSENYFVDCSFEFSGCTGGTLDDLFFITQMRQYIPTEEAYPFNQGLNAVTCPHRLEADAAKQLDGTSEFNGIKKMWLQDYYHLNHNIEDWISGLAVSPVTFSYNIGPGFHHYSGGPFTDASCVSSPEPHAGLFVGYTKTTLRVRNSYGPTWGDGGYVDFVRDVDALSNCLMFEHGYVILATQRREKEYSFCNNKKLSTRKDCADSCKAKGHGWALATIPTKLHNENLIQMVSNSFANKATKEEFAILHVGLNDETRHHHYHWSEECTPVNYVNMTTQMAKQGGKYGFLNKDTGTWVLKNNSGFKARGLCSRAVTCWDISSAINNGTVSYNDGALYDNVHSGDLVSGTKAEVTCEAGTHLVGDGHLVCHDGIWHPASDHEHDHDHADDDHDHENDLKHGSFDELPSCRAEGEEGHDPHDHEDNHECDDTHGIVTDEDHWEKEHADHEHHDHVKDEDEEEEVAPALKPVPQPAPKPAPKGKWAKKGKWSKKKKKNGQ